ncbi:RpiB/LacA/LacB family sugar-phosphate isomerase [Candidatus Saccharibacteria bacterium]|nr:RpiB/LacA/LacB family sugar-phosphate isomerase [Candidatus Saccharibacteria bacterium]
MEVFVGADYRGFELKESLKRFLAEKGFSVVDEGAYERSEGDDFNEPAIKVATAVRENLGSRGILICDSAHGMTMQANRFRGVRAAHAGSVESAKLAREHDDANVLCLSAHFVGPEEAEKITEAFLTTDFVELERRVRRINRLDAGEDYD